GTTRTRESRRQYASRTCMVPSVEGSQDTTISSSGSSCVKIESSCSGRYLSPLQAAIATEILAMLYPLHFHGLKVISPDHSGRSAHCHTVGRDFPGDHAVGTDDAAVTDSGPGQDAHALSQPDPAAD